MAYPSLDKAVADCQYSLQEYVYGNLKVTLQPAAG